MPTNQVMSLTEPYSLNVSNTVAQIYDEASIER
jgi:hypothetical protein